MLDQSAQTRFRRKITYTMLSWSAYKKTKTAHKNYLCNVHPKPKNNFAQENNIHCCLGLCRPTLHKEFTCAMLAHGWQTTFLSKINYTMVCLPSWENICIGKLYTQCCPNLSETALHKKITCAMLALRVQRWFWRKITHTVLSWSAWAKIAQNNNLYNAETVTRGVL